jgi:protein-S-isoprenylcysteine O-methyltransferase Ste14
VLPFLFSLIVFIFACINPVSAADVSLTITQKSLTDSVLVKITNSSLRDVVVESVEIGLNQKKYVHSARDTIKAGLVKDFVFSVQPPHISGSYILLTTVKYLNEGTLLTVKHADFYHYGKPAPLPESCTLETITDGDEGYIQLTASQVSRWSPVIPDEFELLPASKQENASTYKVRSAAAGFTTTNQIFSTTETVTGNVHRAAFCSAILTIKPGAHFPNNCWIPGYMYIILTAIFCALCAVLILMRKHGRFARIMVRYGSRMFFLSISCFLLKEIGGWLALSMNYLTWAPYQWLARILLDNINGGNYRYFFQFFVDGYFVLCLLLVFPCLYWLDGQRPASEDKYVASIAAFITLPGILAGKHPVWNDLAKLGILTIMVKFFFTPMMVSWAIGGFYTMINGLRLFQWNVYAVNAYLVQLLIMVDTVIFSLGYLIESKYLKNEIKSVEPTLLGWLVCLWCYPPFNAFSFKPLDFYIIRINLPYPVWLHVIVLCAITLLWATFMWASVALGFKASNLTNRGIVRSGPYRYVRHPAYMAKLMIWILQGIFFAQFGAFILFGFIIIYVLRAWTEERHLSRDRDYLAYKQSVRWWFIPGLI